jgi:hypothetical protein
MYFLLQSTEVGLIVKLHHWRKGISGVKMVFQEAVTFRSEIGSRHMNSNWKYDSKENNLERLEFGEV